MKNRDAARIAVFLCPGVGIRTSASGRRRVSAKKIYGPPPFCNLISYDVSRLAQIYPASDGDLLRATMRVAPVGPKKPLGL
jgi:hypothetical protein